MLRRVFCKLLLVAVVIFSFLVLSDSLMAQGRSQEAFQRVKEVQERHALKLMEKKGVIGTAIGLNEKGSHIVLVFLEKPGVAGIPKDLEGIPVKQKVTGMIYALKPPTNRPPKPPRALTATAFGENLIELNWKDSRDSKVLGYNIYRATSSGDYNPLNPLAEGVEPSSYSDTTVLGGTTYYYVVTAVTSTQMSNYSNEASATTESGVPNPPSAPSGLSANAVSSSQINLSWTDNSNNETGFRIERKSGGGYFSETAP